MFWIKWIVALEFGLACAVILADHSNDETLDGPIVTVDCGQLRGKVIRTERRDCDAYFGVQFAAPPTGYLRWRVSFFR